MRSRNKEGISNVYTGQYAGLYKKVEATRAQRMATEPRRMTADEKDALLAAYHPDYKEEGFITLKVGPNKGEKVPTELGYLLESNSRILGVDHRP